MTIVTVNKHVVASNKKHGKDEPPIGIRKTKGAPAEYVHAVEFWGPTKMVYKPDAPLKCGARLWLEAAGTLNVTRRHDGVLESKQALEVAR